MGMWLHLRCRSNWRIAKHAYFQVSPLPKVQYQSHPRGGLVSEANKVPGVQLGPENLDESVTLATMRTTRALMSACLHTLNGIKMRFGSHLPRNTSLEWRRERYSVKRKSRRARRLANVR